MIDQLEETFASPGQVLKEIEKGQIRPCYLLWGEEDFLIKETLKRLVEAIIPPENRDLNLVYITGEWTKIKDVIEAVQTAPLISGKKVVVVTDAEFFQSTQNLPDLADRIRELIETNPHQAGRNFISFLSLAGLRLEDVEGEGWEKQGGEKWKQLVSPAAWEERDKWLPKVISICRERGFSPDDVRDESHALLDVLTRGLPEDTHLILTAHSVDRRKKLYKIIGGLGKILYFGRPKGQPQQMRLLMEAVSGPLIEAGKELTAGAWSLLAVKVDFDLYEARQALEKLINFASDKDRITEADVEEVVSDTKEVTVFELIAAIIARDLPRSLHLLDRLLLTTNHMIILSFLAREIRFLAQGHLLLKREEFSRFSPHMDYASFQKGLYSKIKDRYPQLIKGGSLLGQHPYVIYNALKNVPRFPKEELFSLLDDLLEMDLAVKTTGKDPRLLIERFIVKICSKARGSGLVFCTP